MRHSFFFSFGVVEVHCQLMIPHWVQNEPGTAFALPRDGPLWILDPHYIIQPPPSSSEMRGSDVVFVRLYIEAHEKSIHFFDTSVSTNMTTSRLPGVISISRDLRRLFLKHAQAEQMKTVCCAWSFIPWHRLHALSVRKLKRYKSNLEKYPGRMKSWVRKKLTFPCFFPTHCSTFGMGA